MIRKIDNLKSKIVEYLPLTGILLVAAFFRFYNFPNRISFGFDSSRDAFISLEGAKMLQFPLTGPFISIAPVTTGPWYWIQLILVRLIIPSSYAPWLLVAIYSLLMVIVMYLIGKKLEGKRLGLIVALITALSVNQIDNAVELTNPSVIGFYASLVVYLYLVITTCKKENPQLGLFWGIIGGLMVNTHYQTTGMLSLVLTLLFFGKKYLKTLKNFFIGFLVTFIPLLIFDLNNHWYNVKHMVQYVRFDQYKIWVPMSWTIFIKDFWPDFMAFVLGGTKEFGIIATLLIVVVFGISIIRKKVSKQYFFLIFSFLIQIVIIRYYRGEKYFGYLQFFHPFLFIFTAFVINKIFTLKLGKILGSLALIIYLLVIFKGIVKRVESTSLTADTNMLYARMDSYLKAKSYKLFRCNNGNIKEITSLVLKMEMENKYNDAGQPIVYSWGCEIPTVKKDGTIITDLEAFKKERFIPETNYLYDVSYASESALIKSGWVEATPKSMYQSAARWWFDEQP